MKGQKKQEWIEKGYELVSRIGFLNLNIESFAREMGKSKSSFYHYFGDKEAFELDLLDHHLAQIERYSQDVLECESIQPCFLNILLEHKVDMFFQKQVRLNRSNPIFQEYMDKTYQLYEKAALELWVDFFNLEKNRAFARTYAQFFAENFLSQISPELYTYEWLDNYVKDLLSMLKQMKFPPG